MASSCWCYWNNVKCKTLIPSSWPTSFFLIETKKIIWNGLIRWKEIWEWVNYWLIWKNTCTCIEYYLSSNTSSMYLDYWNATRDGTNSWLNIGYVNYPTLLGTGTGLVPKSSNWGWVIIFTSYLLRQFLCESKAYVKIAAQSIALAANWSISS